MDELRTIVRRMVVEIAELDDATLGDEQRFSELGLDSLQALELLVSIERRFGCEIPQEQLAHFRDVASVVRTVYPIVQPQLVKACETAS